MTAARDQARDGGALLAKKLTDRDGRACDRRRGRDRTGKVRMTGDDAVTKDGDRYSCTLRGWPHAGNAERPEPPLGIAYLISRRGCSGHADRDGSCSSGHEHGEGAGEPQQHSVLCLPGKVPHILPCSSYLRAIWARLVRGQATLGRTAASSQVPCACEMRTWAPGGRPSCSA